MIFAALYKYIIIIIQLKIIKFETPFKFKSVFKSIHKVNELLKCQPK